MAATVRTRICHRLLASHLVRGCSSRRVLSAEASSPEIKRIRSCISVGDTKPARVKYVYADDNKDIPTVPSTPDHQNRGTRVIRQPFSTTLCSKSSQKCSPAETRNMHFGNSSGEGQLWREPSQISFFSKYSCSVQKSSGPWLAEKLRQKQNHALVIQEHCKLFSTQAAGDAQYEQVQAPSASDVHDTVGSLVKVAGILARLDLLITRNVEWANIAFGFEQVFVLKSTTSGDQINKMIPNEWDEEGDCNAADQFMTLCKLKQNKYVIMDPHQPQAPVGYIIEQSNVVLRQVLGGRRPFTASVLDADGQEVCQVKRPAYFINSSIYVEIDGKVVGECHSRWHLWKRIYDVYLGNKQFSVVENPGFWNWTFTLKNETGGILAEIDRNWRGFGYEFLTDAGQYVVRFGDVLPKDSSPQSAPNFEEAQDRKPFLSSMNEKTGAEEMKKLQQAAEQAEALVVTRPLNLMERAVALALAVSLDNDYFSRTSHAGHAGMDVPFYPFYTSEAATGDDQTAGSAPPGHGGPTGYEVFPEGGSQADDSVRPSNASDDSTRPSNGNDEMIAEDPFMGMFDEQDSGNQFDNESLFEDPPDSADRWGLSDWGSGDGGGDGGGD